METQIKFTKALLAYSRVTHCGEKTARGYQFDDVEVWADFDGYTCYMQSGGVTLTLLFHGKFLLEYDSRDKLKRFIRLLDKLAH
ncbi:DUF3081 family protein [Shewanella colwelliana]|uniref:DUF3081 family protein n=1 Tax=Shewanella colwelliana TaxID=23 RepID=UPI0022AF1AC1|nr:DUF3081 family protein [Shewanella colwelliana]MCZ4336979.1 DUF3081 family protein [Shewanella colwelliana]